MRMLRTVCRTTRRSTGGRGLGPDALQCVGPVMAGYAHGAEQVGGRNGHSRPLAIRNRRSSAERHPLPDMALIVVRSAQMGPRAGTAAALGVGTGCFVH